MFPKSMQSRSLAVAALSLLLLATLAGCAKSPAGAGTQFPLPPLSGIIATGTLTAVNSAGSVTGNVAIVANPSNGALTVKLSNLTGDLGAVSEVQLSSARVSTGATCTPNRIAFATGPVTSQIDQAFTFPSDKSPGWENPSYLHSVILTTATPQAGCVSAMAAYSVLTWTTGDRRPDIHVADGGTRTGARGIATESAGVPTSYTVVAGDNLDSIAARFHLTLDGLFYLNPARTVSPANTVTQVGEKLNLSKSDR